MIDNDYDLHGNRTDGKRFVKLKAMQGIISGVASSEAFSYDTHHVEWFGVHLVHYIYIIVLKMVWHSAYANNFSIP